MAGRPIVVVQSGDALENRRRVLPLALACRAEGWDPVLLVDDIGAAGVFFAHGLACVSVGAFAEGDAPEPDFDVDMADLCALQLRRAAAGGKAFPDEEASAVSVATRRMFRLLDAIAPQAVFVWNGFTGVWANALRVYKAARGLPGGFMERGPAAGSLFVDPEGVNGFASFAHGETPPDWLSLPPGAMPPGARPSAPAQRWRRRVIFVPLQVNDDSNILLHSERIVRMRSLALFALELARELGFAWRVVLRRHPEERPDAGLNLPRSLRLQIDQKTGLEDWIDRAGLCLTVNSTVGLTAALRGAPVVALGEGIWCRQPFVIHGQDCDVKAIAREFRARRRTPPQEIAGAAERFMERLAGGALFWDGQPAELAAQKLERCGLGSPLQGAGLETSGTVRIERPGAAYRRALDALDEIRRRDGPIVVDFDIGPAERLFFTYRLNREPITREKLVAAAGATLGAAVQLAATHRALAAEGDVLICHSRRLPEDIGRYRLVLDEFGFLHARTYLEQDRSEEG